MVIKRTIEMPKHDVHPSGKVLVDLMKNIDNMAGRAESGAHAKKDDEIVLRPRPSKRITVKGKIAHIRRATPKLRLD